MDSLGAGSGPSGAGRSSYNFVPAALAENLDLGSVDYRRLAFPDVYGATVDENLSNGIAADRDDVIDIAVEH